MTLLQFYFLNQMRLGNNSCSEYPLIVNWDRCKYVQAVFTRSDTVTIIEPLSFSQCAYRGIAGIMPCGDGSAVFIMDIPACSDNK